MKKLDVVTIRAISTKILSMCLHDFIDEADMLRDLLVRAGVNIGSEGSRTLDGSQYPTFAIVAELNGTQDLERLLLRVASPKEHAGNRMSLENTVRALNQALWPESLRIEFAGVEPKLSEILEPSVIRQPVTVRRKKDVAESAGNRMKASNGIFVIHGRDIGTKDMVARLIMELGLDPIVLQELPNGGRTIIEKLEDYAQVQFAVAIFTPDDAGALADDTGDLKPRSRQNVIFEFGYFIGKLGRARACALIKDDVEVPSDYSGVVYITLDGTDGWKMSLVRELQNAGYDVDANVLTRR